MRRAVIDLSYTNTSLLVTEEKNTRLLPIYKTYIPFNSEKHFSKDGTLKEKGKERIVRDVRELMTRASALGAESFSLISTTLLRKVPDPAALSEELGALIGADITAISGFEEAYALWFANERYSCLEKALLINIGGSSTELCDYSHPDASGMIALPFGAAELQSSFVSLSIPNRDEVKKMKEHVLSQLESHGERKFENAVLSGGNLNAIYRIYQDYWDIEPGDECLMQKGKLKKLIDILIEDKKGEKLIIANCPEKIHLIVPTAVTLKTIISYYGINNMTVSPLGVKEGWQKMLLRKDREETK